MLSRQEIEKAMLEWNQAWERYDLDGVMALFHDDVVFENWTTGRAEGKEALGKAWAPWFENNGGFKFTSEDLFIDESEQKVLYQWTLDWPSMEKGYEGKHEVRRGVDVVHFKDGKIIRKDTFSKTALIINDKKVRLFAG